MAKAKPKQARAQGPRVSVRTDISTDAHAELKARAARDRVPFMEWLGRQLERLAGHDQAPK